MRIDTENNLLSSAQLGARYGVGLKTVEKWRAEGCPNLRLNARTYRYDLAKVQAWLEARQQGEKGAA